MIRHYELVDKVRAYNPDADIALINRAYVFSMKAHGNQRRASGQPYLVHPLEVASIIADLKLDDASIAAALLHDTLEDTLATHQELKNLFGAQVADLVEGVTKLSRIAFDNKQVEQAENYRKLFLAMAQDIRILLIKLADRLHNMRTLHHIAKAEKRKRIARETSDIYAPLAERIGLYNIKTELEDIAFRETNPDEYVRIQQRLETFQTQNNIVSRVVDHLRDELEQVGVEAEISGRAKTVASIYRKMQKKNLTFDQLTDIIAYRIIVRNQALCYEVLGHIHNIYKAIPGRFKDYVSNSKPNGYQSLHTSVIGPFGNRMEVQIRTREMHEVAEAGVAAHWLYKQGSKQKPQEGMQYGWLRQLLDTLQNTEDPEEFIENTKLDLFKEYVFVFTPKGDLKTLPAGATPLDFAYDIHSDIGNKCQTAKVNGRVVPLRTRLNNGDQVEIITTKNQKPTPGWREFVVTGKARAAINRYLRAQAFDEQVALGKEIMEKAARRDGYSISDKDMQRAVSEYGMPSVADAYAALAQGRLFPRQIFGLMPQKPSSVPPSAEDTVKAVQQSAQNRAEKADSDKSVDGVGIRGLTPGLVIHIAKCCNPLPGEDIVGIINTGRGVTIHATNCKNLEALSDQPDRWLSVRWDDDGFEDGGNRVFQARLRVNLNHHAGALSSFSTEVFNSGGNIVDLHIENRSTDSYDIRCDIEVRNLEHLHQMVSALRSLSSVNYVERIGS